MESLFEKFIVRKSKKKALSMRYKGKKFDFYYWAYVKLDLILEIETKI